MTLRTLNAILNIRFGLRRYDKCCHEYALLDAVYHKIGAIESYIDDEARPSETEEVFFGIDFTNDFL